MFQLAFKSLLSLNVLNLFTFFCFRFHTFRRALDDEMKLLNLEGVANKSKKAEREGITEEEEKILWYESLLRCHNAKALLHTIYFYNEKLFGIRAKEHRDLRCNNFRVNANSITFEESVSKTYYGGLKDLKYSLHVIRHICCCSDNSDHFPCLVNCYTKYLESVKSLSVKTEAFYFQA